MTDEVDVLAALERDILTDAAVASTLRRCVLLGGRVGSVELREWASRELHGYKDEEAAANVPAYRRVPAPIRIDATFGNRWAKGLTISPSVVPEFARQMMADGPVFYEPIGVIEAQATDPQQSSGITLTHQRSADICAAMDQASGSPYQQTLALYWSVSQASLLGIVEHVKAHLAELVAEMRAATPTGGLLPRSGDTARAVERVLSQAVRTSRQ